jgi:hypothetical protein
VLGAVDDLEDLAPLGIGQLVGGRGLGAGPAVLTDSLAPPALGRPRVDAQSLADLALSGTSRDSLVDQAEDLVALYVVVSSSPPPQISWAFF